MYVYPEHIQIAVTTKEHASIQVFLHTSGNSKFFGKSREKVQ